MKQGLTRSLIEVAPGFQTVSDDDSMILEHFVARFRLRDL